MKKKIIISIVAIAIVVAALFTVITINNRVKTNDINLSDISSIEDAEKEAAFNMEYPDRLGGIPATGYDVNSSMFEIRYGDTNYIRKTLGVTDNSGDTTKYDESSEESINGITVTCKGNDGLIYLAVWNDNNFAYTIKIDEGASLDEITEYVEATR